VSSRTQGHKRAAVATAGLVLAVLTISGCGGGNLAAASTPSATLETGSVRGTVQVELDFMANAKAGNHSQYGTCLVLKDYESVVDGAKLAVLNAEGDVVGLGALVSTGLELIEGGDALNEAYCGFMFKIDDVPKGAEFYGVEIAGRDAIRYTEAEVFDPLVVKIGDIPTVVS